MKFFKNFVKRKFSRDKDYFVHEFAICETLDVGQNTFIWPFSHIVRGAKVGKDCNIGENVYIESQVILGDRVTIKNGVQIWNGITIEDDVFIGPNVTFTNDKYPRSRNSDFHLLKTQVMKGASIGANSTLLPGITIGSYAIIGAGSVVTKSVKSGQKVMGNPAK